MFPLDLTCSVRSEFSNLLGEAEKKNLLLVAGPLRKITLFEARRKNSKNMWPLSSRGLSGRATKKKTVFAASLRESFFKSLSYFS